MAGKTVAKAAAPKVIVGEIVAPTFTVRQATEGFGDLDAAVSAVREETAAVTKAAGHVMWNAALLTHNVLTVNRADYVGEGKPFKDQTDYVRAIGYSAKSYATGLKTLGRAIVVHGVKQNTAEYAFLAAHCQKGAVSAAVRLDDTAEFHAAIKRLSAELKEHGTLTGKSRTPQIGDGTDGEGEGGDVDTQNRGGSAQAAEPQETREATLKDVLDALDTMAKGLSREDWAACEDRLNRIITRENTVRAKVAAKS